MRRLLALLSLCAAAAVASAQDTLTVALPGIAVEAARTAETTATAPFAVALRARPAEVRALEPGLSLTEALRGLPGIWLADRHHFALGERLVIRGMGWRAAFGVRGVQVLLDGIPLTLPDGQAVLDVADPAFVSRAEVIRGPASLFWGNAAGGVLALSSDAFRDSAYARVRGLGGSHGLRQLSAEGAFPAGRHRFSVAASDLRRDGFRDYSAGRLSRAVLRASLNVGSRTRAGVMAAVALQDTEHPGALTLGEVQTRPSLADARFVASRSGKESLQLQAGVTLDRQTPIGLLSGIAYGITRRLDNPLPFAYIDLDRKAGGTRLTLRSTARATSLAAGIDAAYQQDDRQNAENDGGQRGAEPTLDQQERVRTLAAFATARHALTPRLAVHAGIRADAIRFALTDRLPEDGDQSGARTFEALSPSAGVSFEVGTVLLFASVASAFETPTTTELVNRPDGAGGLDPALEPQRTRGVEAGLRGPLRDGILYVDAALYALRLDDQLVPFQTAEGRTFFENAGQSRHRGIEVAVRAALASRFVLETTYSGADFTFTDGPDDGNRVPGTPRHHLHLALRRNGPGLRAEVSLELASEVFTDSGNDTTGDGYGVAGLSLGHTGWPVGGAHLQPLLRISNVFDASYVGSVVVNARGGRYFEPAPGRTITAGLNVAF